ncbi:uncharacterized protein LOC111270605 isoform X1 [Varroa jacobsoni]|uniref:uncharacterized protein LOC111270605 isoform X1 n=1 Tax=Varroa jacobsoni TaxID=62625 RepID=UPI000BF6823C|nr:uncharacterized protein LOC111270605 isoform X1 [Varroa jacobsoni]XP_022706642.1 uncharacterized protein LOC111270605 isoform X1 [Varroa jacobsoni]
MPSVQLNVPHLQERRQSCCPERKPKLALRRRGPDSKYSWLIALACGGVNLFMHGSSKVVGVLFVAWIIELKCSREMAAWPFALHTTLIHLAGPVFGLLSRRLPIRIIIIASSFVSALSVALCYFAPDIIWLSVLFGIIHGAATCGAVLMTQVCINQHFVEKRGTAAGVVEALAAINGIVFPPLLEYSLRNYGLHWSMLLLGGCVLNALAFSFAVRSPSWMVGDPTERRKSIFTNAVVANKGLASWINHFQPQMEDDSSDEDETKGTQGDIRYYVSEGGGMATSQVDTEVQLASIIHQINDSKYIQSDGKLDFSTIRQDLQAAPGAKFKNSASEGDMHAASKSPPQYGSTQQIEQSHLEPPLVSDAPNGASDQQQVCWRNFCLTSLARPTSTMSSNRVLFMPFPHIPTGYTLYSEFRRSSTTINRPPKLPKARRMNECHSNGPCEYHDSKRYKLWKRVRPFLTITFWHLTFSQFLVQLCLGVFLLTILDFAYDKAFPTEESVYFVSAFCLGDLMARLVTGYIADADVLPMELIVLFACSLQSAMFQCLMHSRSYVALILTAVGMGASHGARIFLLPMFITKSFGLRRLTLNVSTASCICGLLMLVRPFIIGYYRDGQGSYKELYRLLCVANACMAITWLFKLMLVRRRDRPNVTL